MTFLDNLADKVEKWHDKAQGVIYDFGVVENYNSHKYCSVNELRIYIRKPEDQILLTFAFLHMTKDRNRRYDKTHVYLDFNARGITRLYETLQTIESPYSFTAAKQALTEKQEAIGKSIWKKICQFFISDEDIVNDFGVINSFFDECHHRKSKVKALLRMPKGQTILTLDYTTRHHNTRCEDWLEFDEEGIKQLTQVIKTLHEMG